ncbi:hypothetical protein [Massilia sp. S19_KUP03_FR1]|uniref:hypothetical protein n=1 Tax=Massilia sp. S19_KUP03_FR1 TaxID=3025503 RepID=UPI002FCD9716
MRDFHRVTGVSLLLCGTLLLLSCSAADQGSLDKVESCATENYERVSRIRSRLEEGKQFLQEGENRLAIEQFRIGIERMGYDYILPDTIDDTGLRFSLAGVEEHKSNFSGAAHLLSSVLETRIRLCEEKFDHYHPRVRFFRAERKLNGT